MNYQRMQDEMSRFEAEISGGKGRTVIGSNTFNSVQQKIERSSGHNSGRPVIDFDFDSALSGQQATVSSAPQLYKKPKIDLNDFQMVPRTVQIAPRVIDDEPPVVNLSKLNELPPYHPSLMPSAHIKPAPTHSNSGNNKKDKKVKKMIRAAGGQVWEDQSLQEWGDDDFRLFCGDLGNDVTDELLIRTFSKYASFTKAKVIRDKRTNKSKGFGFVSFKEPADFIKAMKEMNGRYVGSRPIKLRKSTWKNRCLDVVKKKEKEKAALISLLTGSNKRH